MWFTIIVFFASLLSLLSLFELKYVEQKRGVVYAPVFRSRADHLARELKRILIRYLLRLEELPLTALLWIRAFVHLFALWLADMARKTEAIAHALANFVAHQRHFENRETTSDFLKKVSEGMNGRNGKERE